ncbi:single-stranded DNA-binding protein [Jeotgalicoccus saudimassiliensis]
MAKSEKKLIKKAWQETKNLKEGEVFLLKDLFKGYKWNRIETETRSSLGRLFLDKVEKKKSVEVIEKTSSNQQQYRKLG